MNRKPKDIDDYFSQLGAEQRSTLEDLRKAIKAAAPKAVECISYQIPAFRLDGKLLVAFGAAKEHCSFFPMSSATIREHQRELSAYETSKGTIRFPIGRSLPNNIVRKLVKARIAQNASGTSKSRTSKSKAASRQRSASKR
jgi:uncharacterized protein YdhG (YjbR/CyaY superfamily)